MTNKNKVILILIAAILSITLAMIYFNTKSKNNISNNTNDKINTKNQNNIQSDNSTVEEDEELPNDGSQEETIIYIKNLTFLNKYLNYEQLMKLKDKLNTELKTLDKSIYEVELLEDTYKKTSNGFTIRAKADKLKGEVLIELKDYEYTFQIENN